MTMSTCLRRSVGYITSMILVLTLLCSLLRPALSLAAGTAAGTTDASSQTATDPAFVEPTNAAVHRPSRPLTIRASLHIPGAFHSDNAADFWVTGLSGAPEQAPDVLGVAWTQVPNSWFGAVWRISLSSGVGVIPADLRPSTGQGLLQGRQVLELVSLPPSPGHTYDVQLSYDPGTGAAALLIYNATSSETVFEGEWQLAPYTGTLYTSSSIGPAASDAQAPVITYVETLDHFIPTPIHWRLVDASATGAPIVHIIRRNRTVALEVDSHWTSLPGQLQLRITTPEQNQLIVPIKKMGRSAQTPLSVDGWTPGVYRLTLEYAEGDQTMVLDERDYPVGVVQAELLQTQVVQLDDTHVLVSGKVQLRSDGPVPDARVSLLAELDELVFAVDAVKMEGKIGSGVVTTTLIREWMPAQLTTEPLELAFSAEMTLPSAVRTPYQLVQLTLRPVLQAEAQLETTPFSRRLRVTPVPSSQPAQPSQDATPDGLRVMSYNMHIGIGMDNVLDLQRIANEIAYSGADIIGLNEVDRSTVRTGWVDQAAELAEMLGMYYAFGSNLNYQGGQYGNAVLSRYPIVSAINQHLPMLNGERRGVLQTQIDYNGTTVHFLVTHLGLTTDESTLQLEYLAKLVQSLSGPVILVGDFNRRADTGFDPIHHLGHILQDVWRLGESLAVTTGHGAATSVYSNFVPDRRIDFIFISPAFEVREPGDVFTIDSLASDHRPVVAQLYLHVRE